MALKKQVTDNKGIITRYHKIHAFTTDRVIITVKLRSFATESKRAREQEIETSNVAAAQHQLAIDQLQSQISNLMAENDDESKTPEIQTLTAELNEKTLNSDVPEFQATEELHATEREIKVAYFEPISLTTLYNTLAAPGGDLAGATEV